MISPLVATTRRSTTVRFAMNSPVGTVSDKSRDIALNNAGSSGSPRKPRVGFNAS